MIYYNTVYRQAQSIFLLLQNSASITTGGVREIRTLAACYRTTHLAGKPLRPTWVSPRNHFILIGI